MYVHICIYTFVYAQGKWKVRKHASSSYPTSTLVKNLKSYCLSDYLYSI